MNGKKTIRGNWGFSGSKIETRHTDPSSTPLPHHQYHKKKLNRRGNSEIRTLKLGTVHKMSRQTTTKVDGVHIVKSQENTNESFSVGFLPENQR